MTAFNKDNFDMGHGSERWVMYHKGEKPSYMVRPSFVARFKYGKAATTAKHFVKFLINNFTVEEYFGRLDAGETPMRILESKGYLDFHVAAEMKRAGVSTREDLIKYRMAELHRLNPAAFPKAA